MAQNLGGVSGIWGHNYGANDEAGYDLEIQWLATAVSSEPQPLGREEKANRKMYPQAWSGSKLPSHPVDIGWANLFSQRI